MNLYSSVSRERRILRGIMRKQVMFLSIGTCFLSVRHLHSSSKTQDYKGNSKYLGIVYTEAHTANIYSQYSVDLVMEIDTSSLPS